MRPAYAKSLQDSGVVQTDADFFKYSGDWCLACPEGKTSA